MKRLRGGRVVVDVPGRPRALRTLVKIAEGGPMTMRQFTEASGYVSEPALELRNFLEEAHLITVARRVQGRATLVDIDLTPFGRSIVQKTRDIDAIAEEAAKKRPRKSSD